MNAETTQAVTEAVTNIVTESPAEHFYQRQGIFSGFLSGFFNTLANLINGIIKALKSIFQFFTWITENITNITAYEGFSWVIITMVTISLFFLVYKAIRKG